MIYNFDNLFNVPEPDQVDNAGQARDIATQWQNWAAVRNLSYGELSSWQGWFEELAKLFDLTDEFREEGII